MYQTESLPFNVPILIDYTALVQYDISSVTKLSPLFLDSYFSTTAHDSRNGVITRHHLENPITMPESLKTIFQNNKIENWKFSVADIRKLGGSNGNARKIGLRHLSSENHAIYEQKFGMIDGCSLNITFGKTESFDSPFENLNTKSDTEIEQLLPQYEYGINNFIFDSILDDLNLSENVKTIGDFLQAVIKTQFLLIKYSTSFKATDTDVWGEGLGRFPKACVGPNNIIRLPRHPNLENLLNEHRNRYIYGKEETRKMIALLVKHYKKQMLDIIRDDNTDLDFID